MAVFRRRPGGRRRPERRKNALPGDRVLYVGVARGHRIPHTFGSRRSMHLSAVIRVASSTDTQARAHTHTAPSILSASLDPGCGTGTPQPASPLRAARWQPGTAAG
jgi:hypothetical protein